MLTPFQACEHLDGMQGQVVHGTRVFGDCAAVIRNSEAVRKKALIAVAGALASHPDDQHLLEAHRMLATNCVEGTVPAVPDAAAPLKHG